MSKILKDRKCSQCGSNKTYISKRGRRLWYSENNEIICRNCYRRIYNKNNKAKIKDYKISYQLKNKEKISEYGKIYHIKNREKIKKRDAQRSKEKLHEQNVKKIKFLDKYIYLKSNPRTGTCNHCRRSVGNGEIKRTNIHHIKYEPQNPLAHTIELCVSCHNKEHTK